LEEFTVNSPGIFQGEKFNKLIFPSFNFMWMGLYSQLHSVRTCRFSRE